MAKRTVQVMRCDNPVCDTPERIHEQNEPALGYHLKGGFYSLEWGGGPIPPVFACKPECVGPAVAAQIEQVSR